MEAVLAEWESSEAVKQLERNIVEANQNPNWMLRRCQRMGSADEFHEALAEADRNQQLVVLVFAGDGFDIFPSSFLC
jgi:hypothetical protein